MSYERMVFIWESDAVKNPDIIFEVLDWLKIAKRFLKWI